MQSTKPARSWSRSKGDTVPTAGWFFSGIDRAGSEAVVGGVGLQVKPSGGMAMIEGDWLVRQAIMMLLSTTPGERVMRPDYGCSLNRLLFEPNDATTAGLAIHYVRQALIRWEPRIEILRLDAGPLQGDETAPPGREDENFLYIRLDYRVRASRRLDQIAMAVDLLGGG
jgi:phage baseplate assembly protein W